jgi:hypothetical protein
MEHRGTTNRTEPSKDKTGELGEEHTTMLDNRGKPQPSPHPLAQPAVLSGTVPF